MSLGDGGRKFMKFNDTAHYCFITVAPNLLQHQHQTKESYNNEPHKAENHFNFRKLSVEEVFKTLKTIDAWSKATGAEGIPAKILKAAAGPCSRLLTPLINLSFKSGVFPNRLNIPRITPIFKGGVKFDRENYRPISILPVVSKIHEQLANEQLQSYASLITKEQFEYSKNSSTIALLLKVVDEWKWAKDKGLITTAVLLELQKAFDVIDHSLLL